MILAARRCDGDDDDLRPTGLRLSRVRGRERGKVAQPLGHKGVRQPLVEVVVRSPLGRGVRLGLGWRWRKWCGLGCLGGSL